MLSRGVHAAAASRECTWCHPQRHAAASSAGPQRRRSHCTGRSTHKAQRTTSLTLWHASRPQVVSLSPARFAPPAPGPPAAAERDSPPWASGVACRRGLRGVHVFRASRCGDACDAAARLARGATARRALLAWRAPPCSLRCPPLATCDATLQRCDADALPRCLAATLPHGLSTENCRNHRGLRARRVAERALSPRVLAAVLHSAGRPPHPSAHPLAAQREDFRRRADEDPEWERRWFATAAASRLSRGD